LFGSILGHKVAPPASSRKPVTAKFLLRAFSMATPTIAQRAPYAVEVEAGKTYFWCACGQSKNQPFCDGSHKGTEFTPVAHKAAQSGRVFFCGCKQSSNRPMCDGTHAKI